VAVPARGAILPLRRDAWRSGGQTSLDLVREFAQELPHTSAADAWQRAVLVVAGSRLSLEAEPRSVRPPAGGDQRLEHFFLAGGHFDGVAVAAGEALEHAADVVFQPVERCRQVEVQIKYDGYLRRQESEIKRFSRMERRQIPASFDFDTIHGLLTETRQKLKAIRPASIGQASRIPGVTPSDISLLMVYLERQKETIP